MATLMSCPHCAKRVDSSLENCPYCGGFLHTGKGGKAPEAPRRQTQGCPACGAVVQPGDIICVACGTNLLTGQRVMSEAEPNRTTRTAPRERLQIPWPIVGGIAAAILVVALGAIAFLTWTRDPVNQAAALAAQGRISEATDVLTQYTSQTPSDPRGHLELGKLHWRARQFAAAAAAFGEAARLEPGNREAVMLAVLASATNQSPSSRGIEVSLLEGYVRVVPNDAEAWFLLALARGTLGDAAGQAAAIEEARTHGAAAAGLQQAQGVAAALAGDTSEAFRVLRSALVEAPSDADLQAATGFVANAQGNAEEARTQLSQAVANSTSLQREAAMQLGLLAIQQGEFEEASRLFQDVLRSDADDQGAQFYQAVARQGMGLRPEALGTFETLMRMDSSPFAAESGLRAAALYLEEGDPERALDAVERAGRLGAVNAVYQVTRGRVLMRLSRDAEAQDAFRAAVQSDSEYAPAHLENGLLYVKRQLFVEGIRALERYLELIDPTLPDARIDQVKALIDQLQQTVRDAAPARGAGRAVK